MTGKWTIKKLNRHDGRPLPMPWHAIPPHTPIPPRDLSHHSMRALYEDDEVGTGVTHSEVMCYVNEQIRGGIMSTTPPREESEMTTNIERAAEVMREAHDKPHWSPMHRCDNMAQALADAGLLMPDLPRPTRDMLHAYWDVGTTIIRTGYGETVIVEWQPGPSNAFAIFTPEQAKAIFAAHMYRDKWREREERLEKELNDHHAEQGQSNA